ncbi:hypothetical protein FF1_035199 [Malus domestica]
MELYRAVVKMEQDGDADDKSTYISLSFIKLSDGLYIEHSFCWQPGIQEGAAYWHEDQDMFEDEGFTFVKELTLDVSHVLASLKQKSSSVQKEKAPSVESPTTAASPKVDVQSEKPQNADDKVVENGAAYPI